MTAQPYVSGGHPDAEPMVLDHPMTEQAVEPYDPPAFDPSGWAEQEGERARAGGRAVLGTALIILSALWIGYAAWSAGRTLAGTSIASPAVAQWIAILAGPLALMGLVWLMFGRTRRKEAEQFTRSVVAMRTEARALQDLLGALSGQIDRNHAALGQMAGDLMGLGDQAASRLGAVTADLGAGAAALQQHSAALDRAAESARTDIGVLLTDLPMAEESAQRMAESLRGAGQSATEQARQFEIQVRALTERTREADATVHEAAQRLVAHLTHIESAGAAATARVGDSGESLNAQVDALLARSAEALDQIRSGIDEHANAVAALLDRSRAGIGAAGMEAGERLAERIDSAGVSINALSQRIAEQERASQSLIAGLDQGLAALDHRFGALAESGDERSARVLTMLNRLRGELEALGDDTGAHDQAILAIADRTQSLREGVGMLSAAIKGELSDALDSAEASASRLLSTSSDAHPLIIGARDAAVEAGERLSASVSDADAMKQRVTAMLSGIHEGVDAAESRLSDLSASIGRTSADAAQLSGETAPALVDALVQVREAAAHAGERARAAIAEAIPQSARELGDASRAALERAVSEAVGDKLAEVDRLAAKAVEAARAASQQLTAQMLSIGQSAAALESHIERSREAARKDDGEDFARRVALLMDSMHSASIDVQKILSDEVDERAWTNYLKGNRGVFTRRAVKLIGNSESRTLQAHYDSDPEFHESVNRYIADFETMLRRVLAEREGGMIAITMMSSDMGKLYAALAQAIERRR
jgi:hypothetical protein